MLKTIFTHAKELSATEIGILVQASELVANGEPAPLISDKYLKYIFKTEFEPKAKLVAIKRKNGKKGGRPRKAVS